MQVSQATCNILQNGALESQREESFGRVGWRLNVRIRSEEVVQIREQSLHDEGGQSRAWKKGETQKLDDVRMAEGAHQ